MAYLTLFLPFCPLTMLSFPFAPFSPYPLPLCFLFPFFNISLSLNPRSRFILGPSSSLCCILSSTRFTTFYFSPCHIPSSCLLPPHFTSSSSRSYDDNLALSREHLSPKLSVPRGCSTELSHLGVKFLSHLFDTHDLDRDGYLNHEELDRLFSVCPENPWGPEVHNAGRSSS